MATCTKVQVVFFVKLYFRRVTFAPICPIVVLRGGEASGESHKKQEKSICRAFRGRHTSDRAASHNAKDRSRDYLRRFDRCGAVPAIPTKPVAWCSGTYIRQSDPDPFWAIKNTLVKTGTYIRQSDPDRTLVSCYFGKSARTKTGGGNHRIRLRLASWEQGLSVGLRGRVRCPAAGGTNRQRAYLPVLRGSRRNAARPAAARSDRQAKRHENLAKDLARNRSACGNQ
ncbi:MAG: hypothetical protein PWP48_292 [Clostridiales bacterium]|nr:hypothetical protein [Clostridiales bacterium]